MRSEGEGKGSVFSFSLPLSRARARHRRHSSVQSTVESVGTVGDGESGETGAVFRRMNEIQFWNMIPDKYHLPSLLLEGLCSLGNASVEMLLKTRKSIVSVSPLGEEREVEECEAVAADIADDSRRVSVVELLGSEGISGSRWCEGGGIGRVGGREGRREMYAVSLVRDVDHVDDGNDEGVGLGGLEETGELARFRRVLVVDDAASNRRMLSRLLRSRCGVIDEAVDGVQAVEKVKQAMVEGQQPYDLIFMDFVMPNMDGPTATRIIRELGYNGIVCGLTGNVLDSDKNVFTQSGVNLVMFKPFDMDKFNIAIRNIVCGRAH